MDLKDDQEINWESFRQEMLKAGVPDDEIKDFFQKYDTDGDMTMDKKELDRLKQSFEKLGRTSSTETRQGLFALYLPTIKCPPYLLFFHFRFVLSWLPFD